MKHMHCILQSLRIGADQANSLLIGLDMELLPRGVGVEPDQGLPDTMRERRRRTKASDGPPCRATARYRWPEVEGGSIMLPSFDRSVTTHRPFALRHRGQARSRR